MPLIFHGPWFFGVDAPAITGFALFGAGLSGSGNTVQQTSVDKYTYSSDAVTAGTSIATARQNAYGVGKDSLGLFAGGAVGGSPTLSVEKYTYSDDSRANGTNLNTSHQGGAAAGNNTLAIIAGGINSINANVTKYTYSGDAVTAGTSLSVARYVPLGTGIATRGLITGGTPNPWTFTDVTDNYQYSDDARTTTTVINDGSTGSGGGGGASSTTVGYFFWSPSIGTASQVTRKFTYSSNAVTSGTGLGVIAWSPGVTARPGMCYHAGGMDNNTSTNSNVVKKYNMSDDSVTTGTNLSIVRYHTTALSSSLSHI